MFNRTGKNAPQNMKKLSLLKREIAVKLIEKLLYKNIENSGVAL